MKHVCFALALLLAPTFAASAGEWYLVKDGEPTSRIVIADKADRLVTTAAKEFQYHVREASGAQLPIVRESRVKDGDTGLVLIGPSRRVAKLGVDVSKLPREGYVIWPTRGCLIIAGKDKPMISYRNDGKTVRRSNDDPYSTLFVQPATLFGVSAFLEEDLGVRWLWPGRLGEFVPRRKTIVVRDGKRRIGQPAAVQRQVRITDSHRLGKRVDRMCFAPWGIDRKARERETLVWARRQRLGKGGYFKIAHAFTRWWKKYSKDHPDYFAQQLDGTRNWPDCWIPEACRLCVSNPAVVDRIVENAKELEARRRRTTNLDYLAFPACQNDGDCGWCLCPKCRALDPPDAPKRKHAYVLKGKHGAWIQKKVSLPRLTDRYVNFWNRIGKRFEKELPGKYVGIFAYNVTASPPVRERYGPNLCCAFASGGFLAQRRGEGLARLKASIEKFHKAGLRNWYWRPNMMYFDMFGLPLVYAREAGAMLQYAMSHGSMGADVDSWQGHWATDGLNMYVVSRLLWDPSRDVDKMLDDYYAAFGKAAPHVRAYHARLEALRDTMSRERLADKRKRLTLMPDVYTPALLAELDTIMARAKAAAAGDPDPRARERVAFLALGLEYTRLQRAVLALNREFGRTGEKLPELIAAVRARERFFRDLKTPWAVNVPRLKYWETDGKMGPYFATKYADMAKGKSVVAALPKRWRLYMDPEDEGEKKGLAEARFDDANLLKISTFLIWEKQGFPNYNGIAWYRTRFKIPAALKGRNIYLWFGGVDESYWIYVNGKKVGENIFDKKKNPNSWVDPYTADITAAARVGEENLVSVKVRDIGGAGGIYQPVILLTDAK